VDLVIEVARNVEQAALAPLEALAHAAVFAPYGGRALAIEHIDQLADREFHGCHRFAGRDFHDAGFRHAFHAAQAQEAGFGLALFPPFELYFAEIFYVMAAVDR
jgi:hypothetical protein